MNAIVEEMQLVHVFRQPNGTEVTVEMVFDKNTNISKHRLWRCLLIFVLVDKRNFSSSFAINFLTAGVMREQTRRILWRWNFFYALHPHWRSLLRYDLNITREEYTLKNIFNVLTYNGWHTVTKEEIMEHCIFSSTSWKCWLKNPVTGDQLSLWTCHFV